MCEEKPRNKKTAKNVKKANKCEQRPINVNKGQRSPKMGQRVIRSEKGNDWGKGQRSRKSQKC